MQESKNQLPGVLNTVDLFCGGGGLSCGFDLHSGILRYKTVLGIDNEPAAIRIFNNNFRGPAQAPLKVGRLADITWFSHPVEIRLFYLVHAAYSQDDALLMAALDQIGFEQFLGQLRSLDESFAQQLTEIGSSDAYARAVAKVPTVTFTVAFARELLNRLALASLYSPSPSLRHLPWCEEYAALPGHASLSPQARAPIDEFIRASVEGDWNLRVADLAEAAKKTGRGKNRNNADRLSALASFFETDETTPLKSAWLDWRAQRDSIRARFCLGAVDAVDKLYFGRHRVHLVLGGPPCKGFSRIGRPVIQSLRDQGVHAWSHKEFGDERNALMCQYVAFLEALQPDAFLFENVSNFQSTLRTPAGELNAPDLLMELIDELSDGDLHYHVSHQLLNARHFAVPQDRRRFIMVGINGRRANADAPRTFFQFGKPTDDVQLGVALMGLGRPAVFRGNVLTNHRVPVFRYLDENMPNAMKHYLAWVQHEDPVTGMPVTETDAHIFREGREDDRVFISFVAPGIRWMDLKTDKSETLDEIRGLLSQLAKTTPPGQLRDRIASLLPKIDDSLMLRLLLEHTRERFQLSEQHLLHEGYLRNGGSTHGDWLERLSAIKPCKTIVAHIGKDTYGYWHPTEARALTIREAARVQSFPDFFSFADSGVVDTYAVVGNAVPPLLAKAFATRLDEMHRKLRIFGDHVVESAEPRRRTKVQLKMFG